MKFVLEIELGNEAMQTYADITLALTATATRSLFYRSNRLGSNAQGSAPLTGEGGPIMDSNGNTVGQWAIK